MGRNPLRLTACLAAVGALAVVGGCGSSSHKLSTHDAKTQKAVEGKIANFIKQKAVSLGSSVDFIDVQCLPESDVKLSCLVTGSVGGESLNVSWEALIDPATGKYNIHSV